MNADDEMNSETFDALAKSVSTTVGTRTDLGSRQPGFTENHVTLDPPHLRGKVVTVPTWQVVRTKLVQDLTCFDGRPA